MTHDQQREADLEHLTQAQVDEIVRIKVREALDAAVAGCEMMLISPTDTILCGDTIDAAAAQLRTLRAKLTGEG